MTRMPTHLQELNVGTATFPYLVGLWKLVSQINYYFSGFAGSESLMPTYNHLNKGIRTVDNDTIIFFEPVTWGVLLNNKYVGSGFTTVPGGTDYRNRSVFSYHHYCPIQGQSPHKPYKFWKKFACDDLSAPDVFIAALSDMRTMGSGVFHDRVRHVLPRW